MSECGMPTQVVDFGKNQRNVNTLFASLERRLNGQAQPIVAEKPIPQAPVAEISDGAYCSKCGAQLAPDAAFCSKCGAKVEVPVEPVCSNCGKILNADDAFCSGCGTKL